MKKKNKLILILAIAFVLVSCSSPKFYNEIKSTYPAYNEGKHYFRKDVNKFILSHLSKRLQNSEHIVYFEARTPSSDFDNKSYDIIVWDVDNNISYSILYEDKTIQESYSLESKRYFEYVYKYFKDDDCTYLKMIGDKSGQSGIRVTHTMYEIDLRNNVTRECSFLDIFFTIYMPEYKLPAIKNK